MSEFIGKKVAVIGMARSGLASARVLKERGAVVCIFDSRPADELQEALRVAGELSVEARPATQDVGEVDFVVTSPGVRRTAEVLQQAVSRGIPVLSEIEAAFRISTAPILAITGTNGKTTTAAMLTEMISASGVTTYLAGNVAAGEIAMPLIAAASMADESDAIVAEISSFQLEWVDRWRPKVAAILNISPDHLDRQTPQEYVASKWRIMANMRRPDVVVTRSDVPRPLGNPQPLLEGTDAPDIVMFDQLPRPQWLAQLRVPGDHNKENAIAAAAMARAFGVAEEHIALAAVAFKGVVHRLEEVATIRGVRYINNSMCTNNEAFDRSLDAVMGSKIVIAGGVYKGGDLAGFIASAKRHALRHLILFGRSSVEMEAEARAADMYNVTKVDDLLEAVTLASEGSRSGDIVLLSPACASFDQFKDFEDRGEQFKRIVKGLDPTSRAAKGKSTS